MLRFDGKNIQTLISEPSRYLKSNPTHAFTWKVLMNAPINDRARKNLEASFIALSRPSLNEQIDAKKLLLFRNGGHDNFILLICNYV